MSVFYKLFRNWKPNVDINFDMVGCQKDRSIIAIRLKNEKANYPSQLTEFIIPNFRYQRIIEALFPHIQSIDIEFIYTPDEDEQKYLSQSLRKAVFNKNKFFIHEIASLIAYFEKEYDTSIMKLEINVSIKEDTYRFTIWGDGTIYAEDEKIFLNELWPTLTPVLCNE